MRRSTSKDATVSQNGPRHSAGSARSTSPTSLGPTDAISSRTGGGSFESGSPRTSSRQSALGRGRCGNDVPRTTPAPQQGQGEAAAPQRSQRMAPQPGHPQNARRSHEWQTGQIQTVTSQG